MVPQSEPQSPVIDPFRSVFLQIKAHSKIELPFWLAHTLSYKCVHQCYHALRNVADSFFFRSEFTTFPIPAPYSPRVRQALNASSTNVKLSHLVGSGGWWYVWGRRISSILDDQQRREMLGTLRDAWQQRLGLVYDLGSHYGAAAASGASSGNKQGTGDLDADAGGGGGNSAAGGGLIFGEEFKEGMDAEERLRESPPCRGVFEQCLTY